jgi:hypothetical protein
MPGTPAALMGRNGTAFGAPLLRQCDLGPPTAWIRPIR